MAPLSHTFARAVRRLVAIVLTFAACFGGSALARTDDAAADEYQVKAVFLFNFARFVDWPEAAFSHPEAPVVIGIVGSDPFGEKLDEAVRGEKVHARAITVRRLRWHEDLRACHIVYISPSERARVPTVLGRLSGQSVLTVSDIPDFAEAGGMIGFVRDGGRITLEINLDSARTASLTVSSKLLRPSRIIGPDRGQLYRPQLPRPLRADPNPIAARPPRLPRGRSHSS